LPFFIVVLAISCIYILFFWQPGAQSDKHSLIQEPSSPQGGDFTLQSLSGTVSLKDFRGKVVLIYFGYTMCPDICPTNLAIMSEAIRQLESTLTQQKALATVQGIFISVDPQRDTMKRLSEYTHYFHDSIVGLSSTPEIINEVAERYGVAYRKVSHDTATNYVVDHSSETYVVDTQGKLVERLAHATPPEKILAVINKYARQ